MPSHKDLWATLAFCVIGFIAKAASEFVHEVLGHGSFVLLFGGSIREVRISLLWPYTLSYIKWEGTFEAWQMPWIHGGGIFACLVATALLQALALRVEAGRMQSYALLWLSFWTLLNPAGYLFLGGIVPFGDIKDLIGDGVLRPESALALALGTALFAAGFFSLSLILRGTVLSAWHGIEEGKAWAYIGVFWLTVPVLTYLALMGRGLPRLYALSGFVPSVIAFSMWALRGTIQHS